MSFVTNSSKSNEKAQIFRGFRLLMLCNVAAVLLILGLTFGLDTLGKMLDAISLIHWAGSIVLFGYMFFLVWQLLHAVPLILRFRRRHQFGIMKGIVIGAAITALVNGVCYVALLSLTSGYD